MRKAIKGFEGLYEVDINGNVYSLRRNKKLRPNFLRTGYAQYSLSKNGKRSLILGHRLVAEAFVENPNHYPIVNHKDENKKNNEASNLEWCTYSYNSTYGSLKEKRKKADYWRNGVKATKKSVCQIKDGEIINIYSSITEASKKTGTSLSNISQCCLGKRKSANKYKWKFKEGNKNEQTSII